LASTKPNETKWAAMQWYHARAPASGRRGLVESAHQLRVSRVNKADRLRAVDRLRECVVEEGVLDVELVHGPTPGDSQCQHSPNSGRIDDRAEGLIIVHPRALGEPPEDPTTIVMV
jgi:hypothetical protein